MLSLPPWLGTLVTFLVCGGALWRGGREERLVSAALLLNFAATIFLRDYTWSSVQRGGFVVDALTFAFFLAIALRSAKFWPMAAAAFQLLAVMTHVAKVIDPGLQQWAYITAIIIWTYLLLAALGVGSWNAWRARTQPGSAEAAAPAGATRR